MAVSAYGQSLTDAFPNYAFDQQGLIGNRPAPGRRGRLFFATDTDQLFRDTGAVWTPIRAAAPLTLTSPAATDIPLTLRGAAGQTGNLFEARNDAGTVLVRVGNGGFFAVNGQASVGPDADAISDTYLRVRSGVATEKGLVVRGAASQTANLQEWQDSAGTVLTKVWSDGSLHVGNGVNEGRLAVLAPTATSKPLVVRGAASQTANLAEFQNSSGTVLARINPEGKLAIYGHAVDVGSALYRELQFGDNDSAGAGYRTVRVANA